MIVVAGKVKIRFLPTLVPCISPITTLLSLYKTTLNLLTLCPRCIASVKQILKELGLLYSSIHLGEVKTEADPTEKQLGLLQTKLLAAGFELLDDTRKRLIEKIKNIIIDQVHYESDTKHQKLSEVLSSSLRKDYSFLSNLFSEVEGITIEKYHIQQKIERAKELIVYNELTVGEIAFHLGYTSVSHLSAQFKSVTGLTPTHFKKVGHAYRKSLDSI